MILDVLEVVRSIEAIVPWWLKAIAAGYLVIAFLLGRPFYALPNLEWLLDLIREIRASEYDQDLITEHRKLANDT